MVKSNNEAENIIQKMQRAEKIIRLNARFEDNTLFEDLRDNSFDKFMRKQVIPALKPKMDKFASFSGTYSESSLVTNSYDCRD